MLKFFGSGDIKVAVREYLESLGNLERKKVIDIPAGRGLTTDMLIDAGADVEAYDIFPEYFESQRTKCTFADLGKPLPVASDSADYVVCQEGIEHIADQLFALKEFNRVLHTGGRLVITTPNVSHLRAKLSYLLLESDLYKRMPPNEVDAVWNTRDHRQYYGHLFLIGIQKLRALAKIAGFKIVRVHPVKVSGTSLLFAWLYPFIAAASVYAYFRSFRQEEHAEAQEKRRAFREIVRLNLSPTILFGKHLFIEFEKERQLEQVELPNRNRVA